MTHVNDSGCGLRVSGRNQRSAIRAAAPPPRFAFQLILSFLLCGTCYCQVVAPTPIRVETVLVNVPVVVTGPRGAPVSGLEKEDFALFEDGLPREISVFAAAEEPVSIALLLDTSKSTVTVLNKIKKSARSFVGRMRPRDRALVMTFDSEVQLLTPLSDDRKELDQVLKEIKPGEYAGTRLRDAVLEVTANRFRTISGRKAIVLLSDGQDYGSRASIPELLASVVESGTLVYSVYYRVDVRALVRELLGVRLPRGGVGQGPGSPWEKRESEAASFLNELSELSAGRFMLSGISDLNKIFSEILEELRNQYLLGFYPEKSRLDGTTHELRVEVRREGAVARSRRNYCVLRSEQ